MVTIRYAGMDCDLDYNEFGNMFIIERNGDVMDYVCSRRRGNPGPNRCYLFANLLAQFEIKGIVRRVPGEVVEETSEHIHGSILCDIIHPDFHDEGYSGFGDFSRGRLGQQCQYGSRYIDGRIEGYPALGEGLRFKNLDRGCYHSIRIHRDDMDEFERRYKAYQKGHLVR